MTSQCTFVAIREIVTELLWMKNRAEEKKIQSVTYPEDEVEDKHHVFQTAQAASRHVALLEL